MVLLQDIEQYISAENRKDQEVIAVRLENIKLKNKLKKKEQQLKSKVCLLSWLTLLIGMSKTKTIVAVHITAYSIIFTKTYLYDYIYNNFYN